MKLILKDPKLMKMKVLLSAYACDPSRGGEFNNGWNYAYNSCKDIRVWCLTTVEGKTGITQRLKEEPMPFLNMVYVAVPDWMLKLKLASPQVGVYLHYIYWQYQAFKVAKKLDKEIGFDVVHHGTYSSLQLGSYMWKLGKPMLFGPVGGGQLAPPQFKKYFSGGWKLEKLRDFIGYVLLNVLNAPTKALKYSLITLVVNQDTYELAQKYGAQKLIYAPCTLLPDNFGPEAVPERPAKRELNLLWIGRLLPRKGLKLILEALRLIPEDLPLNLTIIGDGALENELPIWIKELGLEGRAKWLGRQPMEVVKQAYISHDVFIYCSLRESLAAQFFESMAYGLPLITLDLHGAVNFVQSDAAVKIPVTAPEETIKKISEAIIFMYENPDKRLEMSKRAFSYSRDFLKSKRIGYINAYYKELAGKKETEEIIDACA